MSFPLEWGDAGMGGVLGWGVTGLESSGMQWGGKAMGGGTLGKVLALGWGRQWDEGTGEGLSAHLGKLPWEGQRGDTPHSTPRAVLPTQCPLRTPKQPPSSMGAEVAGSDPCSGAASITFPPYFWGGGGRQKGRCCSQGFIHHVL